MGYRHVITEQALQADTKALPNNPDDHDESTRKSKSCQSRKRRRPLKSSENEPTSLEAEPEPEQSYDNEPPSTPMETSKSKKLRYATGNAEEQDLQEARTDWILYIFWPQNLSQWSSDRLDLSLVLYSEPWCVGSDETSLDEFII